MPDMILKKLSENSAVEAIALGGSRAGSHFDDDSDYDVYVYLTAPLGEDKRTNLLEPYCRCMEIGNHFWEYEDNCMLNSGVNIDIIYRDLDAFSSEIQRVVEDCQPSNAYTTCMWHNLLHCKILYDRSGRLGKLQEKYNVPYPEKLRNAIIERQMQLLDSAMPAYPMQIEKAWNRQDWVSVNHRVTEFLASYFDLIFAINRQTHPGEKRLVELCKVVCNQLPEEFEENLERLFSHMLPVNCETQSCIDDVKRMVENLKAILSISFIDEHEKSIRGVVRDE